MRVAICLPLRDEAPEEGVTEEERNEGEEEKGEQPDVEGGDAGDDAHNDALQNSPVRPAYGMSSL